jgi:phosphoribosylaminoimidazole carboxylase PurE protein
MKVLIVMGSNTDLPVLEEAAKVLKDFGIPYEMTVASAHRSPERVMKLVQDADKKGADVIIAGAGMAAHLAGVIASHTTLPVIGVPINASPLGGMDALLSTAQMPPGVPVATVSIGKAGAKNAAILAVQILARKEKKLAKKLLEFKKQMASEIEKKAEELNKAISKS